MYVENYTLNYYPFRYNKNVHTRSDKIRGNGLCAILCDDGFWRSTVSPYNNASVSIKIPTIRDSVISSPHIGGVKYCIYSSGIDNSTGIKIQKINRNVYSYTIFEINDNKGLT